MDNQALVKTWIEYQSSPKLNMDKLWAWEEVSEMVSNNPEEAWPLVLSLIDEAPNNEMLGHVAAGPLEDFIVEHCEKYIEQIEEMARKDSKFRLCLTGVWCEGDIQESLYNRIHVLTSTVEQPL